MWVKLLAERVEAFRDGNAAPAVMCVFGKVDGHAVLPYRLDWIDSAENLLHIYDSSFP